MRVEGDDGLAPAGETSRDRLDRARPAVRAGLDDHRVRPEGELDRASPVGNQLHPADSHDERGRGQLGAAAEVGREPGLVPDELPADETRGQAAAAALGNLWSRPPHAPLLSGRLTEADGHGDAGAHGLGDVREGPGRHQRRDLRGRLRRRPADAADREPVAVGGRRSVIVSRSISRCTPVSIGSVSSRLDDGTTWAAATASAPPSTVPAAAGSSGSFGYSSCGSNTSPNSALPHVSSTMSASDVTSTSAGGRLRAISASSRPGTRAVPGSPTSAATATRAETS